MLSRLLRLDEAHLRSHTLARFTGQVQIQDISPLFSNFHKTIQVCPCCLDESRSYDRLYWRATPLLLCPRHNVFLHQTCPTCQRPIPTPRPRLSLCRYCGADYRQHVVPVPSQADWLLRSHLAFLTQLGVDASELGIVPVSAERTFSEELPQRDYFWVLTRFLAFFEDRRYRPALLSFLTRALPAATLLPGAPSNPYLILHYLLSSWPVHWWVLLERLQHALGYDLLWWGNRDEPTRNWEKLREEGGCWQQGIDREQTMVLLRSFFDAVESALQQTPFVYSMDKWVSTSEILLASELRAPEQGDTVHPQPWEDLTSVICRVARRMHYEDPAWLLISEDVPRQKIYSLDLPLLHRDKDYRLLSRQLGLSEEALYQATLHRLATRLQPPIENGEARAEGEMARFDEQGLPFLNSKTVWQYCLSLRHTKVCPMCLEEALGYDRLYWRLRPLILCPVHSNLLVDKCPDCGQPIPSLRPTLTQCPYCQHGDYRRSLRTSILSTSRSFAGQALLFHQLTSEPTGNGEGPAAFVGSPVLLIKPWQYFSLWERFGKLQLDLSSSIVLRALSQIARDDHPVTSGSVFIDMEVRQTTLFHYLLAAWPENLLAFCNRLASQPIPRKPGGQIYEHFWQFDQLVDHLWSSLAHAYDSFDFLSRLIEVLHVWAALSLP